MMTIAPLDTFAPAIGMMRALREGYISSVELLEVHLRRIEQYNPQLNAIVTPNYDEARNQAERADLLRARDGDGAALLGLPLTIKECIYLRGLPTTGGVPERVGLIDEEDARLSQRVRDAGGVILGKTNVPPYASDWQSSNPIFGRSNNPWDLSRTPGGSTGGGAAAVAAGLTPLEFGGDFAGSIRIPAAFCGIYGHKPSLTAALGTGHFPGGLLPNPSAALAVVGPLARSALDLEMALDVIAGPEVGEDVGWKLQLPPVRHERLEEFRVAVLPSVDWLPTDASILHALQGLAETLRRDGVEVVEAQPEALDDGRDYYKLYQSFMGAIEGTGLSPEKRRRRAAICNESGDEFLHAYADGLTGSAAELIEWHGVREWYRASYRDFFRRWDVLLAPANIVNAFPHDDSPLALRFFDIEGHRVPYWQQSFYAGLANLSGHPSTAFPTGRTQSGVPVGLQAIGPYLEDRTPIRFTAYLAAKIGGYQPPPGYAG